MSRKVFEIYKKNNPNPIKQDKSYTPKSLVCDLLKLIPFEKEDFVLDAGSGYNKVWFNCIPITNKEECEIEEGKDFYDYDKEVDWVVGNPPFTEFVGFLFKSAEICRKGFAFLTNHTRINQLTPKRLQDLADKGFYLSKIHIFEISKWFGRYYFLIFTKEPSRDITWSRTKYKNEDTADINCPTERIIAINREDKSSPNSPSENFG